MGIVGKRLCRGKPTSCRVGVPSFIKKIAFLLVERFQFQDIHTK
jgi:hypothetical protein